MSDASDPRSPAGGAGVSGIGSHLHLAIYDRIWATQSLWQIAILEKHFLGFRRLTHLKTSIFIFLKFNNSG